MKTRIQVDGGVSPKTAHIVAEAGADVLVAGSAVYGAENPAQAIDDIRTKAEAAFKAGAPSLNRNPPFIHNRKKRI